MNIKFRVKSSDAQKLAALRPKLQNLAPLMQRIGRKYETVLQDHFEMRDAKPNRRGWPKTHFWARIANATAFTDFDANSATVSVGDRAFAAKLYGARIRPTGGLKYLAIPAVPERNGVSPRAADDRDLLRFHRTRRGGVLGIVRSDGSFAVQYFLVKEANVPRDPNALPKRATVIAALTPIISSYLK